ncbi:F-box/LRR-repeat protein fbxl-1-like [Bolinopsis microptera]|uniref:F-box/LRR-repeat protein fbxl-1-like n=1 Tax=Bolinopsis microptera TaxID=2820187 RepID=UPI00307991CF
MVTIRTLSDELLVKVFGYLSPVELVGQTPLVCRKWRNLSYDSKVWDTLDLHHHHEVSENQLRRIVWLHCSTRKLILRYRRDLSERSMIWCVFHLKNLRALDLSHCPQVNSRIVSTIVQFCKKLRHLNVNGCTGFDNECVLILTGCRKLRHLNFSECETVTDFGVNAMTSFLPKLNSVLCDGVLSLHDEVIEMIVTKKCNTITDLQLDGGNLTDEGVEMLSELRYLRRLRIQYCDNLTDDAILDFHSLLYLEELSLTRAHSFSTTGFVGAFSRPHHFMRIVEITECSGLDDVSLTAIGRSCPNLTDLNISWCRNVTDDGMICFLERVSQLQVLKLQSVPKLCDLVALIPLYTPSLAHLNVISCSRIREEDLLAVAAQLPDLQIAYNRDLGCSPKTTKMLKYFDLMSPRQFAMTNRLHRMSGST